MYLSASQHNPVSKGLHKKQSLRNIQVKMGNQMFSALTEVESEEGTIAGDLESNYW